MKEKIRNWLRGALRSWTVWFSALLVAAPPALDMVQSNWQVFTPFLPETGAKITLQVVGLIVFLLRMRTSASLAIKGEASRAPAPPAAGV